MLYHRFKNEYHKNIIEDKPHVQKLQKVCGKCSVNVVKKMTDSTKVKFKQNIFKTSLTLSNTITKYYW